MTRHAKNCTAGAVYTYHEKQKDTKTCGYGTQKDRIGKDSVKDFDCCCLTLQPCHNPVVTPQGFQELLELAKAEQASKAETFLKDEKNFTAFNGKSDEASTSKQSICNMKNGNEKVLPSFWIPSLTPEAKKCNLKKPDSTIYCPMSGKPLKIKDLIPIQFMLIQDSEPKSLIARKQELLELAKAEQASKAETFLKDEKNFTAFNGKSDEASTSKQSICNMKNGNEKVLPSFWIPSLTPEAKKCNLKKPDSTIYCPMSGKPLKIKDLIPIQFMLIQDSEPKSLIARKARYKCAVTHDVLSNSIPCAVLKTSGSVVTVECVEKIIRKEMIDPINGKKLTEKDIIYLQRGGTGYSSTNESLKAEIKKPVMMA
ncbi:nitric oxide synthase-interacting protein-like [Centruroides sculpturatus]|uniref:nitric oxide synthase-interacting protein-like n=1 Tax=Centruroides sculpturatus TaxID=218467 RepID=UPI000C6DF878|nr:nitric oxide synthase-interacting protein-like [Centruroides sculpturatus]